MTRSRASRTKRQSHRAEAARGRSLFPSAGPATLATLFHGLDGGPPAPADPEVWSRELQVILRQRLAGLALTTIRASGVMPHPETGAALEEAQQLQAVLALNVEATATEAAAALQRATIPVVITKGPGIANVYPQRSLRSFGDIDILVPPRLFGRAHGILIELGYGEYFGREPRDYFNRWCREGVNLIREDGASIDLHHHVPPWVWGRRMRFVDLLAGSKPLNLSMGILPVASPAHNLVIAALHVISDKGQPGQRLLMWRDLVELSRASDPGTVVRIARDAQLDWLLSLVLRALPSFAQPRELIEAIGAARLRAGDAFRLHRLLPPALGSRHQVAQAFRLPTPNAAAFLIGYLLPSHAFLHERFGNESSYSRWWREAFGRLRAAQSVDYGR